jgi:hypothetical protein
VDSLRCLPDGVMYRSSIFNSSSLVLVILDTSCDSHAFQSRLDRVESVRRGGEGVPTTKLRTDWLVKMTAEPSCRRMGTSAGLPNDMTLSFGKMLMPSVFREYTLGDKGDMMGLGDGVGGTEASGRSLRITSICSMIVRDVSPETARQEKLATLYTRSVSRGNCRSSTSSRGVFQRSLALSTRFSICSREGEKIFVGAWSSMSLRCVNLSSL